MSKNTWPQFIWLQSGVDGATPEFRPSQEITWCEDNNNTSDVEYVRTDVQSAHVAAQAAEIERLTGIIAAAPVQATLTDDRIERLATDTVGWMRTSSGRTAYWEFGSVTLRQFARAILAQANTKPITTDTQIIDKIDRPGFAWSNLTQPEQRNLLDSIRAMLAQAPASQVAAGIDCKLRLDAYYYGFSQTGVPIIDRILSAVACAGKSFHNTDEWSSPASPREGHPGETPIDWIQEAANDAAIMLAQEPAQGVDDTRDAARWRHLRNLSEDQMGLPGRPCIAMPNGMSSGYYLTDDNADYAVDSSIAALTKDAK